MRFVIRELSINILIAIVLVYMAMIFAMWEFNPKLWGDDARIIFIVFVTFITMFTSMDLIEEMNGNNSNKNSPNN